MARLDRLAPVKRVIQAAACIGREFDAELLAEAIPMCREDLDRALGQLIAAQLIFRRSGAEGERFIFKHALVQDAAYGSLLKSARPPLHARIARALETSKRPDMVELARHNFAAGAHERAAELYLGAARSLLEASAAVEAAGVLERGLDAVRILPAGRRRDDLELQILTSLGTARTVLFGWQHPSVREALEPAYRLANALEERDLLGPIFWLLTSHFTTQGDVRAGFKMADSFREIATATERERTDLLVFFHLASANHNFWFARFDAAIEDVEAVERIYDPRRHASIARVMNHDPISHAQNFAGSLCEWIRGYPDRALRRLDKAVARARQIRHPFDLVFNLTAGGSCLIYLDQTQRLLAQCEEAEEVAVDEALGPFAEQVCIAQWRGAALIQSGELELGYALVTAGNEFWNGIGGFLCDGLFKSWQVAGLFGLGRLEEALDLNRRTVAHCRETGEHFMEAECVRMQGELVLAMRPEDREASERLFREAISIARAQHARSWELRAATSLARLLHASGRSGEAVACLRPILSWFGEGLHTPDIRQARTVLATAISQAIQT